MAAPQLRAALGTGLLLVLGVASACSSSHSYFVANDAGQSGSDADASTEGETESGDAAARDASKKDAAPAKPLACAQKTSGELVRVDGNPTGDLPDMTGGTVADGHYVLEQAIVMSDGDEPKIASDLWIQGGRYEYQRENSDGWHYSYGGTFKTSGTTTKMTVDCGGQDSAPAWQYTADGDELTVTFTTINGFGWVYVFRRRN